MKKTKLLGFITSLTVVSIALLFTPTLPIGSVLTYIDLDSGVEVIKRSDFWIFHSVKHNSTILSDTWAKGHNNRNGLVLINKIIIFPFSKEYFHLKVARKYYQLKNFSLEHSADNTDSEKVKARIKSFIIYCENNDLIN